LSKAGAPVDLRLRAVLAEAARENTRMQTRTIQSDCRWRVRMQPPELGGIVAQPSSIH
jgi:hypothetical protein